MTAFRSARIRICQSCAEEINADCSVCPHCQTITKNWRFCRECYECVNRRATRCPFCRSSIEPTTDSVEIEEFENAPTPPPTAPEAGQAVRLKSTIREAARYLGYPPTEKELANLMSVSVEWLRELIKFVEARIRIDDMPEAKGEERSSNFIVWVLAGGDRMPCPHCCSSIAKEAYLCRFCRTGLPPEYVACADCRLFVKSVAKVCRFCRSVRTKARLSTKS
jgi:hypothetical protein